jgi:tetratricopeptide (TPR) repeat protein
MPGQLELIGRDKELASIEKVVNQWGTRKAVFLNGPGGIGKTRLLTEIYKRYADGENQSYLVAEVIDFDDRALHLPENVERRIARRLSESAFEPYLRGLLDFHKMEAADVSLEILQHQNELVRHKLIENFNQASAQQRIILLLDTIDKFESKEVWHRLTALILQAKNAVFFLAGRQADHYFHQLQADLGNDAILIDLQPFSHQTGRQYLDQKQQMIHNTIDPALADKLVVLSKGRPILIDLAVEWLARDLPLPWMIEPLSDQELQAQQAEFEVQLVNHIGEIRKPIDRLTLLMARVYPLNQEMISALLHLPEADAHKLFQEALSYVFVKSLPDGRISLHDEMRRMVREHVWPTIDTDEERQRSQSRLTVTYLQKRIAILTAQIQEQINAEKMAQDKGDVQAELNAFTARQTIERELWEVREQLLYHTMFVDPDQGVKTFATIFDEATDAYRFAVRELLLEQMERQMDDLSPEQRYEIDNRRVKYWLDTGSFVEAEERATAILESKITQPEQTADTLIQRGNVRIRLGKFKDGIADFEAAVQLCHDHHLQDWLGRALNARGWANRLQGDLEAALTDYLEAYQICIELNDQKRVAWILNNMGYVNAYKGQQQAALDNCLTALDLWEEIGFGRGMGATHSNLGEIYRRFDQLAESMTHYNKALNIFRSENDVEWISTVLCGRASVLRLQNELDRAEEDLTEAAENSPKNLQPRILFEQAKLHWVRGQLAEAHDHMLRCETLSQEIGDNNHDYRSFVDNLELIWAFGDFQRWQELSERHQLLYASREGDEARRLHGSAYRKLADLAICAGQYETALAAYQKGFSLIAANEVHRPYTVGAQIRRSDEHLQQCQDGRRLRSRLGRDMIQYWHDHAELVRKFPEALIVFGRWQREGEKDE